MLCEFLQDFRLSHDKILQVRGLTRTPWSFLGESTMWKVVHNHFARKTLSDQRETRFKPPRRTPIAFDFLNRCPVSVERFFYSK